MNERIDLVHYEQWSICYYLDRFWNIVELLLLISLEITNAKETAAIGNKRRRTTGGTIAINIIEHRAASCSARHCRRLYLKARTGALHMRIYIIRIPIAREPRKSTDTCARALGISSFGGCICVLPLVASKTTFRYLLLHINRVESQKTNALSSRVSETRAIQRHAAVIVHVNENCVRIILLSVHTDHFII